MKRTLLVLLLLTVPACATNPLPATPVAQAAQTATDVIHALDVVRDTAILLNSETPPVLSTATTAKIVTFHESAMQVLATAPSGWKPTVLAALAQLQTDLAPADWQRILPYVTLVQTLITAVP